MKLSELATTGAIISPWPLAIGDRIQTGATIPTSPYCERKCGNRPVCHTTLHAAGEHLCPYGMSYFKFQIDDEPITVFGLRSTLSKDTGNRILKDALKGRSATLEEVQEWANSMQRLVDAITADFIRRQAEMLEPLHDPMRLVRQVLKLSQSMAIASARAQSLDEALSRSSPDMKSLVKAADFLNESFDMLTIYFNPEAASFPRRYNFSLHGMLKKIVGVFSIDDEADTGQRSPTIHLSGSSYRSVSLRENFKLVPFALITNAIKYSIEADIRVNIAERATTTEVSVESVGPCIEQDEISLIFGKKVRGRWAIKHSSGSGVGLYLADVIARANGFQISVTSLPNGRFRGSIPLALNKFWFEVPSR